MMPSATAIKGAGSRGVKRFMPTSSRTMNTPTATVGSEAWPTLWTVATRLCRKPPLSMCVPNSLGNWSSTMTTPMPALKPTSTGSEMKLATKPRRSNPATIRIAPTIRASVAEPASKVAASPSGLIWPNAEPARMARVVVVLTLSGRDVPSTA
ncbi:hypothetical protein D3C80_1538070 [compost metagenome]